MAILVDAYAKYYLTSSRFDQTYQTGEEAKYFWSGNINSGFNYGVITPSDFNTGSGGGLEPTPTGPGITVAFTIRGEIPQANVVSGVTLVAAASPAFATGMNNAVNTAMSKFLNGTPLSDITWPGGTSPTLIQKSIEAMFKAGAGMVGGLGGLLATGGNPLAGFVAGQAASGLAGLAWDYFPPTLTGVPSGYNPPAASYGGMAYLPEEGTPGVVFVGNGGNGYANMLGSEERIPVRQGIARDIADDFQNLWQSLADMLGGAPAGTFNDDALYDALYDAITTFSQTFRDEEELNRLNDQQQADEVFFYDGKSVTEWISILAQYVPSGGSPISLPFAIASMANTNAYVPWSDPGE